MAATGTDEYGGAIDRDFLAVWDMRDGALSRLEVFARDDDVSAHRRAEELAGGWIPDH